MPEHSKILDLPVGCKILFKTPEGDYEGSVKSTTHSGFIEIDSFLLPDEDYLGVLRFRFSEILSYQILDAPQAVTEAVNPFKRGTSKQDTAYAFDNSDDDLDAISVSYEDQGIEDEKFVVKLPPAFSSLPSDLMVIDQLGENFDSAIAHLKREPTIGLNLEGEVTGRHGTISWLCVSTSKITYLFDACELKNDLFTQGIRDVMQDTNIMKVIHDCRLVSDIFLHKFETKLVNVFDTQVADKYVETQRNGPGHIRHRVSSLNSCLRSYLNIPEEFLYRPINRRFDHLLYQRPPGHRLLDVMIKNVIYLRNLKEQLEDCMLEQFHEAVETSVIALPSCTDEELLLDVSVPERLPDDVTMRGIRTIRSNHYLNEPTEEAVRTSHLLSMLQKYSEGKWSESSKVEESLPSMSTFSENELSSCTSKPLEYGGVKPTPNGSFSDQTSENCDVKLRKCPQTSQITPTKQSTVEPLRFRGIKCSPNSSVLNQTAENSDVQLEENPQTTESAFDSLKFSGIRCSPNTSISNEMAQNGNGDLQKYSQSPDSSHEFLKFRGVKHLPFFKNKESTWLVDTQKEKLLPTASVSSIPDVFDSTESDHKSYGTSSDSESVTGKAFGCFSSSECSYSEEESEHSFEEKNSMADSDPWERLRAEMSEYLSPIEGNMDLKRRLVPAGQQQY